MLRNVGAVLLGMLAGSLANMAIVMVDVALYPLPEGFDMQDPVQLKAHMATLPALAWIIAVVAHLAQVLVGGLVAGKVGDKPLVLAMIIAVLSMVGGVMNLINLGAPTWMWAELPLYLLVGYAVGEMGRRRMATTGQSTT